MAEVQKDETTVTDAPFTANAGNVGDVDNGVPADYVRKVNQKRSTTEHVSGGETTVDVHTDTDDDLSGKFDNRVMELFNGAIREREARENNRANHRNFNRLATLIGAVVIGVLVVLATQVGIIPSALAPYSFAITVAMDSAFTAYALIKHY